MKNYLTIEKRLLERLTDKAELVNVILGTGPAARDLRFKLRLLNLNVPYLVGRADDFSLGIKSYTSLSAIEDPCNYQFLVCYDHSEWDLYGPTMVALRKLLGAASHTNPRIIEVLRDRVSHEKGGAFLADITLGGMKMHKNLPFTKHGHEKSGVFKIFLLGSCQLFTPFISFGIHNIGELLNYKLEKAGLNTCVYSWGQPHHGSAECLQQFIRDGISLKPDAVIVYNCGRLLEPLTIKERNTLPLMLAAVHPTLNTIRAVYQKPKMNGMDHPIDTITIWAAQHRIFYALSQMYGFTFWNIFAPHSDFLSPLQSAKLGDRTPRRLERMKKLKNAAISAVEGIGAAKDYSTIFDCVDDIFLMFIDDAHLTDEGSEYVAERMFQDIVSELDIIRTCTNERIV